MKSYKNAERIAALAVFIISFIVFFLSAERTGSLWDCGEFILGAYKLQVVHPPGAPLFLLVARLFAGFADMVSSNPADIAFAVNLLSGLCSAALSTFVALVTMMIGREIISNDNKLSSGELLALTGAGIGAGLTTAFSSSIWFSAVEGEVYAMSTFFTALTLFAVVKWYYLPNTAKSDRWLVFACYSAGLSIGVHLLSLLTFPALALFVYFKKYKKHSLFGGIVSMGIGALTIPLVQKLVIVGIPTLWYMVEMPFVNTFGLPVNSGIVGVILILIGIFYFLFRHAKKNNKPIMQLATMATLMTVIGYSTIGMVVIRANADTPVNMNVPSDITRLLPYINREQYGERPLVYGPYYGASPVSYDREKRKGLVDFPPFNTGKKSQEYVYVDEKITPKYAAKDKTLFPRVVDGSMGRPALYKQWGASDGKPSFLFNVSYFLRYQVNWMYFRYFMWNFTGRQNGNQGYQPWNESDGQWESGIKFIDEARLYNMDKLPDAMKRHKANNHYYFIPLILGFIGVFFHLKEKKKSFLSLAALFLITGIGIIIYTNQPPNEPRERDYVLVGSFFTFAIWIGLAALALFNLLREKVKLGAVPAGGIATAIVLAAPMIMAFQNFDDHSRAEHSGSRDYANNFLQSVDANSIIFTYGDNDTYPLWYAQEVEGIRRDVRVVNLSLIAVDWYINKLRSKQNDSPPIKLTVPTESYRGNKRNQIPFYTPNGDQTMDLRNVLKFIGGNNQLGTSNQNMQFESYVPTHKLIIPTNYAALNGLGIPNDSSVNIAPSINIDISNMGSWLTKNDLAVMDIIGSNIWERPIYFATTCQNSKLLGLNDYMQYEGLALRIVPIKTPSNKSLQIYGSGRVNADKAYDNIMNKFKWGNFDKKELFVDNSYAPAVQSHRFIFLRTGEQLINEGKKDKAIALANKYFEAFPNMNFRYNASSASMIQILLQAGDSESAKKHIRILGQETAQFMTFYDSIDPATVRSSFQQDHNSRRSAVMQTLALAQSTGDQSFIQEMNELVGQFSQQGVPN
ncbi:MAG: DUF2723 domain-containing protein [Saprospiraceae bacterium]